MSHPSQFDLLKQRRFAPFFWTQFLGAFNDNLFKTALVVVLAFETANWTTLDPTLATNLVPGLFILPYVLFSATSGQIAEKIEKGQLARFIKWLEIGIMGVAALGWFTHNFWLLIAAVFGMGMHSTLFGPVKYAYMPQHLKPEELTGGNGIVEMGTFVGILLGQVFGAVIVTLKPDGVIWLAAATVSFAVLGLVTAYGIPRTPAPQPDLKINWNPFTESVRNIKFSSGNRTVFLSMLGNSWFWFYGAIVLAQFPVYAKEYLKGDNSVFVLLLTMFSLGIGAGSLLCEKLSGRKVEIGLVPFGSIGLSLFGIDLYLASQGYSAAGQVDAFAMAMQPGAWRIILDVIMIGVFGGFFIVPLFALIQLRADPKHLSRTIAGMNIMNALFMVIATGVAILMLKQGFTIPELFLATAIMNGLVAVYIFTLVPEFLLRFLAWMLIHTVHKVKTVDADRIPEEGGAVLVCNHVSYVDALVIVAASPRPIRFVMDHRIFKTPFIGWIFRTAKAIPIASAKDDPWLLEKAWVDIAQALHDGELVCIFPEGKLTRDGEMSEFKGGISKIIERSHVPVIPMALRGLWGHLLSRSSDNLLERAFRKGFRSSLSLAVGQPVAPVEVTPDLLHRQVAELRGDWK